MFRKVIRHECFYILTRNFSKVKNQPELTICQGKLCGSVATDIDGNEYYKFQGIPYAKPPLGELRFKEPQLLKEWSGTLDATKEGSPCYSSHIFSKKKQIGSENCLFLNVYTKNLGSKTLKPVIFEIHPGGFVTGSGSTELLGPDFLITEDVVVVTINYRLGILGFLSLEDPTLEVPGNAGFKDMVMALRWVQLNIYHFGGDPNNVTIVGQSAGGTSVHLLMLSELSQGLFSKVIAQSGCALTSFSRGIKGTKKIAPLMNNKPEREIYYSLIKMSVQDLHKIQSKIDIFHSYVPSVQHSFGYVVETPNDGAFLTEEPFQIILKGRFQRVPFIVGHTSKECLPFCLFRKTFHQGYSTCEDMVPHSLGYKFGSQESQNIAKELRRFYLGSDMLEGNVNNRVLMESDMNLVYGIYKTIKHHFRKSPVYFYRVSLDTKLNIIKRRFKINHSGAAHSDDIGYLFKTIATPKIDCGSKEDIAMRRFVKLWTNFAKYGHPTPSKDAILNVIWKPVTNEEIDYLDIGENLTMSSNPEELKRVNFLDSLFTGKSI